MIFTENHHPITTLWEQLIVRMNNGSSLLTIEACNVNLLLSSKIQQLILFYTSRGVKSKIFYLKVPNSSGENF